MSKDVDDFLEHFGVKGMHWGVRRDRGSGADRHASADAFDSYINRVVAKINSEGPLTKADYEKLSSKGETFAKGTTLNRITQDPSGITRGVTFVSRLKEDNNFYKAAIPAGLVSNEKGAGQKKYRNTYEVGLETVNRLSLPSPKARVDAFTEILGKNVVHVPGHQSPMTGRDYLKTLGYGDEIKSLNDQEVGLKFYKSFLLGQGHADDPLNDPYFSVLKKKGYNALSDDQNKGTFTRAPLILLDANGAAKVNYVRKLTTEEINQAQRNLKGKHPGLET
jgi:hypothetical protein